MANSEHSESFTQQSTNELIASIPNRRARRTAQTAAFVFGMSQQLPELSPEERSQIRMNQAISDAENGGGYPPPPASQGTDIEEPGINSTSSKGKLIFRTRSIF